MNKAPCVLDLKENQDLTIILKIKDKEFEFPSKVIENMKIGIYISPIRINGKILNLENRDLNVQMLVTNKKERPILYKNCYLILKRIKDIGAVYLINEPITGTFINRRGNYRVDIGRKAYVQVGVHNEIKEFMVKDLSTSGFCIVGYDEDNEDNVGKRVSISFDDTNFNYHINLIGVAVREKKLDNQRTLIGCRLNKDYPGLDNYISLKQREYISRNSGLCSKGFDYTPYKRTRKAIR